LKYSAVFKFLAIILCAATLLGAVGSAAGLVCLTEMGGKSVEEAYRDQLESQAIGYAQEVGGQLLSRNLGQAKEGILNQFYPGMTGNSYFHWNRVGYVLRDPEGKVIQEQELFGDDPAVYAFDLPVYGEYLKVMSTMTQEEYDRLRGNDEHQTPAEPGIQVHVMPAKGMTEISAVYMDYNDGHSEEWSTSTEEALGALHYDGGNTLTFESNHMDGIPEGDGWYPIHVLLLDMGGNTAYEVTGDSYVILGSEQDGAFYKLHLPAGTVTATAPMGITFTSGSFESYDAIPAAGATVSMMNVTYGTAAEGAMGSEGVSSPDLIGTVYHDPAGNVRFQSTDPMTMDIPEDALILHITFQNAREQVLYEAECPEGVGYLQYDENGHLMFQGTMPGTVIPEAVPQETVPEELTQTSDSQMVQSGERFALTRQKINIYSMPTTEKPVVGSLEAGQVVTVILQSEYFGKQWGMIEEGWILLDDVVLMEAVEKQSEEENSQAVTADVKVNLYSAPVAETVVGSIAAGEEITVLRQESVDGQQWGLTDKGWILMEALAVTEGAEAAAVPVETVAETVPGETEAVETRMAAEETEATEETAATEVTAATEPVIMPEETAVLGDDRTYFSYYDDALDQNMVAVCTTETIPEGYTVTVQLAENALKTDIGWTLLRLAAALKHLLVEALGICIAVGVVCAVYLCCAAGHRRGAEEVRAGGLNRIPLDLYLGGACFGGIGLAALAMAGAQYLARNDQQLAVLFLGGCSYLICLLVVGFCFAFAAQIKTPGGYWWRNSFCGWCIRLMILGCTGAVDLCIKGWIHGAPLGKKLLRWLRKTCTALWIFSKKMALQLWDTGKRLCSWCWHMIKKWTSWSAKRLARLFGLLPITWQFLATGFVLVLLLYIMMRTYKVGYILLGFGIFFAVILYAASAFGILLENARRMSKGDLDTKVDDRMLIGGFKDFAGNLNDLADVAVVAAQKQLKSERMKTELITNVSHDIKTPLTSIINYVDLMRKPHTPQQQEQYLEVLDRQSQRLKKLVDDLMEMSKASTGNLTVDIQKMDAAETVNQALGEFADKLERAQLTPVFRQPEETVEMLADGRLVWRVMSNILGNAVKYALPGTRVYLDLMKLDGKVIISMKNISREELNVNADELMERFVRGDASRNTEGSGLGLNIAQSLMQLQKGQLQILVDGDLFKVTLIFPAA